ncbi:MAG: N-6 DNA methylase [Chloroflexi bacterium]|nr:N-6 DNA methylase [Chloroflexota bacterium]
MTPQEFVNKWSNTALNEVQVAQAHFLDVCKLVGLDMPGGDGLTADGDIFTFERAVQKKSGYGRADVFYEGRFVVEYKTPDKYKDLDAAFRQLMDYKDDLKNPLLLVVTDINRWEIHTNFNNTQNRPYIFTHKSIASDPVVLEWLKAMFHEPQRLHPRRHTEKVTQDAAQAFQLISDNMRRMRKSKSQPAQIAYFLTKLVFCMFAEDVRLLPTATDDNPDGIFTHIVKQSLKNPNIFTKYLQNLFAAMNDGGELMMRDIRYFNGTLFIYTHVEKLYQEELEALAKAAELNWQAIEPSIFGTLFERSLDPSKRAQLGAHYTSREDIELIVEPVLMQPLRYRWDTVQLEAQPIRERYDKARTGRARNAAAMQLLELREEILVRIRGITVLDPACGSGNFLYVSLQMLMDMEKEVIDHELWAGLQRATPEVHPRQLYGIEINPIAHALASIVVWIGYIQWRTNNAYADTIREPILEELKGHIVCKDAILPSPPRSPDRSGGSAMLTPDSDGVAWPAVDVIVGNPPFLGNKRMWGELGDEYYQRLTDSYAGVLPSGVDLVCYWFEMARQQLERGKATRAGLLATNSIRGGSNREVLKRIKDSGDIFMAWSDRSWILDGAAVRVSMVGFDNGEEETKRLDGVSVKSIFSNLTADIDITDAKVLTENARISFQGIIKRGSFDIPESLAIKMIAADPRNREVLKPIYNGMDITRRPRNMWIIDFGVNTPMEVARQYQLPFAHVEQHVKPQRHKVRQMKSRLNWWLYESARPKMRAHLQGLSRFICTPRVAKHRIFVWVEGRILPDTRVNVFARSDDYFFGLLNSSIHELWSLRLASWHGVGNDPTYNNTTCFETFPFPWSPGHEDETDPAHAAISAAAKELQAERHAWQNPAGADEAASLKDRTLTNLYNALQVWRGESSIKVKPAAADFAPRLDELHRALDSAVCAAYGWETAVLDDEEALLRRLLALNLERAERG